MKARSVGIGAGDTSRRVAAARLVRRHAIPGLAALTFVVFACLYVGDRAVYFTVLDGLHEHPFARPFLDTRFVTAQVECWSRGIDVYRTNPCDPLGRTLDYSPLWLRLRFLARSDRWTPPLGLAVDLAFLTSLFGMPWRTRGAFGIVVALGAVLSWATIFAGERGNTDLLIFAVAVLFAHLATRSPAARGIGYAAVLCAGLLKFYPLVLLALVAREDGRRPWVIGGGIGIVLLAFAATFHAELGRIGGNMADTLFGDMFGARGLPFGLPLLLAHATIRDPGGTYVGMNALTPALRWQGFGLVGVLVAACVLFAVIAGRRPSLGAALDRVDATARSLLLTGAVLCVGCFFGHQNIGYRAVLLLLTIPGLLALVAVAPDRRTRLLGRATCLLIVLVLWGGILTRSRPGWVVMQLSWWWITAALLAIAARELGGDVARLLGGRAARPSDDESTRPIRPARSQEVHARR